MDNINFEDSGIGKPIPAGVFMESAKLDMDDIIEGSTNIDDLIVRLDSVGKIEMEGKEYFGEDLGEQVRDVYQKVSGVDYSNIENSPLFIGKTNELTKEFGLREKFLALLKKESNLRKSMRSIQ